MSGLPPVTRYELWRHARSLELWAVRIDADVLTGISGPLEPTAVPQELSGLLYEEHPDDLEWVIRASEHFAVVEPS